MPVVGGRAEGPPHILWPLLAWMFLRSDLPPVETTYVASLLCIKNLPLIFHTSKLGFLLDIHICWHSERQGFGPASAHTWGHPEGRTWREMRWGDLIVLCWLSSQPAASLWILFWGEEIYVVCDDIDLFSSEKNPKTCCRLGRMPRTGWVGSRQEGDDDAMADLDGRNGVERGSVVNGCFS